MQRPVCRWMIRNVTWTSTKGDGVAMEVRMCHQQFPGIRRP